MSLFFKTSLRELPEATFQGTELPAKSCVLHISTHLNELTPEGSFHGTEQSGNRWP